MKKVARIASMAVMVTAAWGCGSPAFVGGGSRKEEDAGAEAYVADEKIPDAGGQDVREEEKTPDAGVPDVREDVPPPPCCVDEDCPASIPFCSPWGTCYQGGDPYNCDYDSFCESFCVHCSGSAAGACEEKRCVCS